MAGVAGVLSGAGTVEGRADAAPKPPTIATELAPPLRKFVPQSIDDLRAIEKRVESLVPKLQACVVALNIGAGSGSGVIVSEDGYVLTAAHVTENPDREIRFVLPDGRKVRGKSLGANHEIDAGLAKITDPGPWPYVEMNTARDTVLGDWALTLGHPGGYEPGRPPVVRLGRVIRLASPMLQTDCTITAGDSGGPLFDLRGRVIGIHSRISDSATENFHVPVEAYRESWDRLLAGEKWGEEKAPARPSIGARGVDHPDGCKLELVEADGTAAKAGIRVGDIIHSIDGAAISGSDSFRQRLRESTPGDTMKVVVLREGKELTMKVTVGTRKNRR